MVVRDVHRVEIAPREGLVRPVATVGRRAREAAVGEIGAAVLVALGALLGDPDAHLGLGGERVDQEILEPGTAPDTPAVV